MLSVLNRLKIKLKFYTFIYSVFDYYDFSSFFLFITSLSIYTEF